MLVAVMLVAGCGEVADAPSMAADAPSPRPPAHEIAPPSASAAGIDVLSGFYEQDLGQPLPDVVVHWTDERIDCSGVIGTTGCSFGCGDIWVTFLTPLAGPLMSDTALAHELAHCARFVATGDADGSHADRAWWARDSSGELGRALAQLRLAGL